MYWSGSRELTAEFMAIRDLNPGIKQLFCTHRYLVAWRVARTNSLGKRVKPG